MAGPVDSAAAGGGSRAIMGFVDDETSRAGIVAAAEALGLAGCEIRAGGIGAAGPALKEMPTPQRLVVDLSSTTDPLADLAALAEVCEAGTRLVAIGITNDIEFYRKLIAAGVDDYLLKPIAGDALAEVLRRIDARAVPHAVEDAAAEGEGHLIAVVGTRGGAGATTVAVNMAWSLANDFRSRTALVDLDLYFGSCALALDLEPGRGFREALENPDRIDSLFVERAMVRESENLYVLAAEDDLEQAHMFDPTALHLLIEHLRRDFRHIVLDIPRFAARTQGALLTAPVSVVLVSEPTIAGMRDTLRLAKVLRKSAAASHLAVVLNRAGAVKGGELPRADFERDAGVEVGVILPFDGKSAAASAASGKPLLKAAARSTTSARLRQLTRHVAGVSDPLPSGGRLASMLKLSRAKRQPDLAR